MSITKTVGGDRLGAGKKQKQTMHGFERSTHDLSYLFRTTMSAGTLVPFMKQLALPGSTFDIELDSVCLTQPTIGPLFGSFKAQYDVFITPLRLYQGQIHNNKLKVGMNMATVKFPYYELNGVRLSSDAPTTSPDNTQINPSCILAYLGQRGIGIVPNAAGNTLIPRNFNGIPWIAYWDIYKNYYSNKQEEIGAVIHTPLVSIPDNVTTIEVAGSPLAQFPTVTPIDITEGQNISIDTTALQPLNQIIFNVAFAPFTISAEEIGTVISQGALNTTIAYNWAKYGNRQILNWYYADAMTLGRGPIQVQTFQLSDIDAMRENILAWTGQTTAFKINDSAGATDTPLEPWAFTLEGNAAAPLAQRALMGSQEGLGLKCYQSDLLNNWMSTEWIDGPGGIAEVTAIDTTGGSITIDTIIMQRKVYDMLNRIGLSGGTYDDWQEVQYDHKRYTAAETPMYMGGLSKELIFQEVISNSESGGNQGQQPLGTLAGRGKFSQKHKGGRITIKVDEPSYIIGIVSLTPRIDYSQGNDYDIGLETWDELHVPGMDQIGFQDVPTEWMAWWDVYWSVSENKWIQRSVGKQPAWTHLTTNINKTYGNFAIQDNEMFMTLNRQYDWSVEDEHYNIDDLTTYIDPAKYNNIFAQTKLDAQNFWMQISVDITARKKMSAKAIPNL